MNGPNTEVHELPLATRLAEDAIGGWLRRQTALARAANDHHAGIDLMEHLYLADYATTVVPRLLDELRRAGLLHDRSIP